MYGIENGYERGRDLLSSVLKCVGIVLDSDFVSGLEIRPVYQLQERRP